MLYSYIYIFFIQINSGSSGIFNQLPSTVIKKLFRCEVKKKAAKTPYQTKMERKLLYAFRGWIAFVAFMDLGTAFRSYIERRSFLGDHTDTQFIEGKNIIKYKKFLNYFLY